MAISNEFALLDKDFLIDLDQHRNKELFCKIVSLNWDEDPITELTGNVSQGSINIDTKSTVRRTCNLTLITDDVNVNDINWSLRTKFKVWIGVRNDINKEYDDIIWFPQGTYVITSFSSSLNTQGYTITIQGKDKMCLLNGDVGGDLFAAHDFSRIWTTKNDGTIKLDYIPIHEIIKEAVHTYALEPYENIIINDLDTCGVELVDYIGEGSDMYTYRQFYETDETNAMWMYGDTYEYAMSQSSSGAGIITASRYVHKDNGVVDGKNTPVFSSSVSTQIAFAKTSPMLCAVFNQAISDQNNASENLKPFKYNMVWYEILRKVTNTSASKAVGYRATDLTYPDELVIQVGGNIGQLLDKLTNFLGEFEYYYDVDGRFIFQRKRIYCNQSWSNAIVNDNETYYDTVANGSNTVYDFKDGYLLESFQNKPDLSKIRNDFSIWGEITGASGNKLPVHLRYAIDTKPMVYYSLLEEQAYYSSEGMVITADGPVMIDGLYDWRELIYQMARDNLAAHSRINGLTAALATHSYDMDNRVYHYNWRTTPFSSIQNKVVYKWNDIDNKFETVDTRNDTEYNKLKSNNEFIYGEDITHAYRRMSTDQIEELNNQLGYDYYLTSAFTMNAVIKSRVSNIDNRYIVTYDGVDFVARWNGSGSLQNNAPVTIIPSLDGSEYIIRNMTKEAELIEKYQNLATFSQMQFEIDAWQDTYTTGYEAYYADMLAYWPLLYRTKRVTEMTQSTDSGTLDETADGDTTAQADELKEDDWVAWQSNGYWNPTFVAYNLTTREISFVEPESMYFWIEFIDPRKENTGLYQYSVDIIGRRAKSVNDKDVKGIYFREVPNVLFVSSDYTPVAGSENLAYARINLVPPYSNYFRISKQGKSAKEALDTMLYEHTYLQETITLSTIPIYYLEPNTRISVQDDANGISGEYLVKSFTIPLQHDGMMSITANRAVDRIL